MSPNTSPKGNRAVWSILPELGYWFVILLYWEVLLHGVVYDSFEKSFFYGVAFTAAAAIAVAGILSFVPRKGRAAVSLVLSGVLMIFYGSQLVYFFVFGSMYSVSLVAQGGQAITNFWRETLSTMLDHWGTLGLLILPFAGAVLGRKWIWKARVEPHWRYRLEILACAVLVVLETVLVMKSEGTGAFSDYDYYTTSAVATDQNVERFGLLTTFRLELSGTEEEEEEEDFFAPVIQETQPVTPPAVQPGPGGEETQPQEEPVEEKPVEYNVLPIDFDALNTMTDKSRLLALNDYCSQLAGTNKNEYTGMLADYNLILLCGESFSTGAIDPVLTPTLYRLASEGIIFNNFYNSYPNITSNGEYGLLQGLYPDTSRGKEASSMLASRNNYLPFTLGNVFQDQLGIQSWGYHNFYGNSYGRNESHPNLGYHMQFAGDGMSLTSTWPRSDVEMMEQTVDDYIGEEQFHAYYMTFSGHYQYKTSVNGIATKNWDLVKDLDYTYDEVKAYLACNIELDRALGYLMERLEEAGVAEKTAIVMAGDHIPYGLTAQQQSELMGQELDKFGRYKSTLVFWVGGLEENIVVDEYCCNVDVLPTILNLWGLDYDSRLLAGTDIFSDALHAAVLFDKSWLTDIAWFDTNKGEVRYLVEESQVPEGYVDNMNALVANRFKISANILNTNYYNFLFSNNLGNPQDG